MTTPMIYVLASPDGHRKVGYTSNLDQRAAQISPALPWPVELEMTYCHPRARKIEPIVHRILKDASTNGEWFECGLDRIQNALSMATIVQRRQDEKGSGLSPAQPSGLSGVLEDIRRKAWDLCDDYMHTHGVSQAEIAKKIGIPNTKFCRLLSGRIRIGFQEAQLIADFFNVSIAWLCGESEIREKLTPEIQAAIAPIVAMAHSERMQ